LVKCQLALKEREQKIDRPLKLHGQELTGSSFAIARMNMVLHDMAGEIVRGNTMSNPKFLDDGGTGPKGSVAPPKKGGLKRFDIVVTNPMWNQDNFDPKSYENDPYERFETRGGYAPASSADWAWLQHVAASMKDHGRAAVVIDTGAASRGSGSQGENKEKSIRRWFVEQDLVEGVILLPDNLFYNTTAAGLIIVLNAAKPKSRRGQVLLVNASAEFRKGRPKNELTEEGIRKIVQCFREWKDQEGLCRVVDRQQIAEADYNLSPARFVRSVSTTETGDVQAILDQLADLKTESSRLDSQLSEVFERLGYQWKGGAIVP
jgi:type I restriction enzyme M protein